MPRTIKDVAAEPDPWTAGAARVIKAAREAVKPSLPTSRIIDSPGMAEAGVIITGYREHKLQTDEPKKAD